MAGTRPRRPQPIGEVLKERISALGWERRLREEEVLTGWAAAVGPQIAAHAQPSHITDRRLTVVTESPVWTQQLSLLKPDLLRRIARTFGPDIVSDLYFITGKIASTPEAPAAAAPCASVTELPAVLETELDQIADAEVRSSVRRLMLASLAAAEAEEQDAGSA